MLTANTVAPQVTAIMRTAVRPEPGGEMRIERLRGLASALAGLADLTRLARLVDRATLPIREGLDRALVDALWLAGGPDVQSDVPDDGRHVPE